MLKNADFYKTITGRPFDLRKLTVEERRVLAYVILLYRERPEWTTFANKWQAWLRESGLPHTSVVYRICQDLESRLGIEQRMVAPPDYRDFLSDLIEMRFGSRYRFCKEAKIDPGHLSRILAGKSNVSLDSLGQMLAALGAVLVVRPEEDVRQAAAQFADDEGSVLRALDATAG